MLWGVSDTWWMQEVFKPLPLCSAPPEYLLVAISGALGIKKRHFLSKIVFWENAVEYLRNSEC